MFRLAPMSRVIRWLTIVLFLIPVGFLAAGSPIAFVGMFVALLYAAVWLLWRPTGFALDPGELVVVFPLRKKRTPLARVTGARAMDGKTAQDLMGFALRVGVGGLWGGFGWLRTAKRGWVEFYVSRTDGFVWIDREGQAPLLITPATPDAFVAALEGAHGATPPA